MAKSENVQETEQKVVETPAAQEQGQNPGAQNFQRVGIRQMREAQMIKEQEALREAREAGLLAEDEKKIIGMQSIKKKDGSGYAYKLFMTEAYTAYDQQHGECLGVKVCDEYVSDESKIPVDLALGDVVKINKTQRGQYLVVDEIRILSR